MPIARAPKGNWDFFSGFWLAGFLLLRCISCSFLHSISISFPKRFMQYERAAGDVVLPGKQTAKQSFASCASLAKDIHTKVSLIPLHHWFPPLFSDSFSSPRNVSPGSGGSSFSRLLTISSGERGCGPVAGGGSGCRTAKFLSRSDASL